MADLPFYDLAQSLLGLAKSNLQRDGFLVPCIFSFTAGKIQICPMQFNTAAEKQALYRAAWDILLPENPECILCLNDAYTTVVNYTDPLPGSLAERFQRGDSTVREVINFMVFPRGANAWAISVPYKRGNNKILFDAEQVQENRDGKTIGGSIAPPPWVRAGNLAFNRRKAGIDGT